MPTEKKSAVGEKVLFGPTRPTGVRDPEADALWNCWRFVDVEPAGLADRVAECVRRGTPFYLNELVPRCNLRLDGDAMYQGRVRPAELADALRKAGPLYLGRMICGEYGGMLYWTKNSLDGRIYPRLPKARDLEEARRNFHRRVEEYAAREHAFGGGPYIGLCSGMCYPPIDSKAFDIPGLELEPGDPERLSAAVRGMARAYGKDLFLTLVAHGWYGGGIWDETYFQRLVNAFHFCYLAGFGGICSESGHFGFSGYGRRVDRDDPRAARFRRIMRDFRRFCDRDRRRAGGPETPMAFLHGHLDGYPGLWTDCVWGQFDDPEFACGDPERGWELTATVYRKHPWHDHLLRGDADVSGQPPCGMYDIVPDDIPSDRLARYKLLVVPGWNTMTEALYAKLKRFVAGGGTLFMSLAQLRTNIRRGEPMKLFRGGDCRDLFGVRVSPRAFSVVNGLKFRVPDSVGGRCLWPDWGPNCDPKFSDGRFTAAKLAECTARIVASGSTHFVGGEDSAKDCPPVLLEHRLGKGRAFLLNSREFPGHPAVFPLASTVLSVLMRGFQPKDLPVVASDKIRYAVYGRTIYAMNSDGDLPGSLQIGGKLWKIAPNRLKRIDLD